MDTLELLKQAYEALEWTRSHYKLHSNKVLEAMNTIDAALTQPADEDAQRPGDEVGIGPFDSVEKLFAALDAPCPEKPEQQELGVERAHKVKPLVWYLNGSGAYFWALSELYIVRALTNGEYSASYAGIDDLDGDFQTEHEAKTACQKHHEAFVLSQLEQV